MAMESFETHETPMPTAVRTARDFVERAGSYVQQSLTDLLDRAHDLTREADSLIGDARGFVRTHPLQCLAATIGIGYILGKVLIRSSRA
jgi:ElaB/YqjD/DUF883 family membrane-anchored ribosome-binding protein